MGAITCNKRTSSFTNDSSIVTKRKEEMTRREIQTPPLSRHAQTTPPPSTLKDSCAVMMMMFSIQNFSTDTDTLFVTLSSESVLLLSCEQKLRICSTEHSDFQTISRQCWQNKHHCHLSFAGKFRPCNNNEPTHYTAAYWCCLLLLWDLFYMETNDK